MCKPITLVRQLVLTALLISIFPATAFSQSLTMSSLAWYTQDRDFKPVEVAPWVYEGVQKAFYFPNPDDPKTMDYVDELAAMGVTVMHTGGPEMYYPLKVDKPDSGPDPKQDARLKVSYERMRKAGMRIVIGIWPFAPPELARKHQEWLVMRSSDSKPADSSLDLTKPENMGYRHLGLFTPYGDYAIANIAEIVKTYKVDGVSFDGCYHEVINYNPYEVAMYEKETGRKFPANVNLADPDYQAYLLWADQKLEQWYRKLHERLRQVNPNAAIYTWTTNAGRYGHYLTSPRVMSARMNMIFDSPVQEWWLDEINLGSSVVPAFGAAYVRAVNGGRVGACEPYIMSRGNPYSTSSFPRHELYVRTMMAMTNGAIVPLALPSAASKEAGELAMKEIGKRKKWFVRATQEPWAALLVSEQTRQFYAGNQIMDRFLAHALGVFRVGVEEHLPLTLVTDLDMTPERLKPYKVLILPNAAALSDEQVSAIREYVKNGGGLVATCESSLCNEFGQLRGNFALADVFGVDYLGRPAAPTKRAEIDVNFARAIDDSYWAKRMGAAEMRWGGGDIQTDALINDPRMTQLCNVAQAAFKGPLVKMSDAARPPMKRAMIMFPEGLDPIPAVVMGEFGSGRVVYMAAGFDAANYSYGYPYERVVMSSAIKWAANGPAPIQVEAPMCVQSTFFRQKDASGERLVIQLFNGINTTSDHGLPEVDVPLREETVPIAGIKVRFRNIDAKSIHLEPEGLELKPVKVDEWLEVTVPALGVHSMVVAELK